MRPAAPPSPAFYSSQCFQFISYIILHGGFYDDSPLLAVYSPSGWFFFTVEHVLEHADRCERDITVNAHLPPVPELPFGSLFGFFAPTLHMCVDRYELPYELAADFCIGVRMLSEHFPCFILDFSFFTYNYFLHHFSRVRSPFSFFFRC